MEFDTVTGTYKKSKGFCLKLKAIKHERRIRHMFWGFAVAEAGHLLPPVGFLYRPTPMESCMEI